MNRFTLILSAFFLVAVAANSHSAPDKGVTEEDFILLYYEWHRQCEKIKFSSRTSDYVNLPAFRSIVGLGRKAVPFIREKLERNENEHMLAYAVLEIMGWTLYGCNNCLGEQHVRDYVLKRLKELDLIAPGMARKSSLPLRKASITGRISDAFGSSHKSS